MTNYRPSSTYKFFYDNIIGELFTQIFDHIPTASVKDRQIPFIIGKKFEEYRERATNNMANPRLDRHKLASCICGAIIEVEPFVGVNNKPIHQKMNEIFALHVALNVIKYYMMYDITYKLNISANEKSDIKTYLRDNFNMELPSIKENICDSQEYESNLTNALYWTHYYKCEATKADCFHYDIWAYAKIFYHLELYNKPRLEKMYVEYLKKNNIVIKPEQDD